MRQARLGSALTALFALGTAIASAQSPSPESVGNALLSAKVDTAITSAKSVRIVVEGPTGPLIDIRRAGADRLKITRRGSSSPDSIVVGSTMYDRAADGSWRSSAIPAVKHPRKNQLYLGAPDTLLEPLADRDEAGTPVGAFRSAALGNAQTTGTMDCTYDKVSYRPHVCTVSLKDLPSTMRVTYSGWNDDANLVDAPAGAVPRDPGTQALMAHAAIGVDLGGSHVMAAVVDDSGDIQARFERDISDRAPAAVVASLADVVKSAIGASDHPISAIGIGSPGNVDPGSGTIRYSPNFGWQNVPLGDRVREAFPKCSVFVGNDARCATLGEYVHGVGQGTRDFVLLTLGTGIGGGVVAGGVLALGYQMGAGEVGHHQIRPDGGFICGCGKTGCFEAQASGTGLLRHAFRVAPSFPRSALLDPQPPKDKDKDKDKDGDEGRTWRDRLGSKKIRKAAQAGDPHALAAWYGFCDDLALGLSNVIAFVNPEVIALGGGVSSAGDFLLDRIKPLVEARTTMVPRGTTRIVRATLGNDAGAVGAATAAMRGGLLAQAPAPVSVS